MRNFIIIIIILMIVAGCESDDTPTNPVAKQQYSAWFDGLPDTLVALAGEESLVSVSALLRTDQGDAATGIDVQLIVKNGPASFDSPTLTTDGSGRVGSALRVTPNAGVQRIRLLLIAPGTEASAEFIVKALAEPVEAVFVTPVERVVVHYDQSAEIGYRALFKDADGAGVAGLPVKAVITPYNNEKFGLVTAPRVTAGDGSLNFTFSSAGSFGMVGISVVSDLAPMVEPIGDTTYVTVARLEQTISSLTLTIPNGYADPELEEMWQTELHATVRDGGNNPVPDVLVRFTSDRGVITASAITDRQGVATALFRNELERGVVQIIASIPGTDFEAEGSIEITQRFGAGYLEIWTDRIEIFADGGLTFARIRALLKDSDNQSLSGKWLIFTSTHGAISSPVMTNAFGIVDTIFTNLGIPSLDRNGNVVPAKIYAKYPPLNLIDSCEVTISPRNPVTSISLISSKQQMIAASGDSCALRMTATLANGTFVSPGTLVYFEVAGSNGYCDPNPAVVGPFGVATTTYYAGNFVGVAIIRAFIINDDDTYTYSNEVHITLLPGPPNRLRLTASPTELDANDPGVHSTISAIVTDTAGNAVVVGTLVRFESTLGSIVPSAITGENGVALARLYPNGQVGVADIKGTVTLVGGRIIEGHANVTFTGGRANSIRITADPETIQAAESGGVTNSEIRATVFDGNGVPITYTAMVVFELPDEPELPDGCTWPNRQRVDSVRTANGLAVTNLNAGLQNGPVFIRAYTWRDSARTDTVRAQGYFVTVEGGANREPPELQIGFNGDGDDAGGGTWQIPVWARLTDQNGNPWRNDVPVGFTVIPDDVATVEPGFTGNDVGFGSERGVAWAWLYYHSVKSMDSVTLRAEVQVEDGQITAEQRIRLPLQDGRLELNVDPQNWMFDRNRPDDTCLIRVWANLQDGHQIGINGAPILFRTDRARFYWRDQEGRYRPFFPEAARMFTTGGSATVYLRGKMSDFIRDEFTLEVTVHLEASVEGYDVAADPAFVFIIRR